MTESVAKHVIYFVTFPLRVLYFHGPGLGGYGFQEGVEAGDACEQMTSVRSEFWSASDGAREECLGILERKFNAFLVGGFAVFVVGLVYHYVHVISTRRVIYPAIQSVRAKVEDVIRIMDDSQHQKIKEIST